MIEMLVCLAIAYLIERMMRRMGGPVGERYEAARESFKAATVRGGQAGNPWKRRGATIARGAIAAYRGVGKGLNLAVLPLAGLAELLRRRRGGRPTATSTPPASGGAAPRPLPPPRQSTTTDRPAGPAPTAPAGPQAEPAAPNALGDIIDAEIIPDDALTAGPDGTTGTTPPTTPPLAIAGTTQGANAMSLYESAKYAINEAGAATQRAAAAADGAFAALCDAKMPDHLRNEVSTAVDLLTQAEQKFGHVITEMISLHDPVQEAIAAAGTTGSVEGMGGTTGS